MLLKIMLCIIVILSLFSGTYDAIITKNQISIIGYVIFYIGLIWWLSELAIANIIFRYFSKPCITRSYIASGVMMFGSCVIIMGQ